MKVFEFCVLSIPQTNINLDSRQLGFRKHTGCDNVISMVKEVIQDYNSSESHVYGGFIDLIKAFDRIIFSFWKKKN